MSKLQAINSDEAMSQAPPTLEISSIYCFFKELWEELKERKFTIIRIEKVPMMMRESGKIYNVSVRNIDEGGKDTGGYNHHATKPEVKALLFLSGFKYPEIDQRISKLMLSGKEQTFKLISPR